MSDEGGGCNSSVEEVFFVLAHPYLFPGSSLFQYKPKCGAETGEVWREYDDALWPPPGKSALIYGFKSLDLLSCI